MADPSSPQSLTLSTSPPPPPHPPTLQSTTSEPPPPPTRSSLFPFLKSLNRPKLRVTSEFDSDSLLFLNKVSCKLFDNLAKLKLSFQNNSQREVTQPQLSLTSKYLSVLYDVEEKNTFIKSTVNVSPRLQLRARHNVNAQQGEVAMEANLAEPGYSLELSSPVPIGYPRATLKFPFGEVSIQEREEEERNKRLLSVVNGIFKRQVMDGAQQGEVAMEANLAEPVPIGYPRTRTTLKFPFGEVSILEREEEERNKRMLSVNGILKRQVMDGVCSALYTDEELRLRYAYKDEALSFIPTISLPSNAASFAFKRRFSPSDKLSYWYKFDSNMWSAVYKRTYGKDYKFKAGYDSEVRLGWASLWVGDEAGKVKTTPMKMKVQFMLQVPQDDIRTSVLMFRVKKRWDI